MADNPSQVTIEDPVIREKFAELTQLMGGATLSPSASDGMLAYLAKTDPAKYNHAIELANDINEYYKSQHWKLTNGISRVWDYMDVGTARDPQSYARRILASKDTLNKQAKGTFENTQKQISSTYKNLTKKVDGASLYNQMKQVRDAYIQVKKAYDSIPDEPAYQETIDTYVGYLSEYVNMWNNFTGMLKNNILGDNMQLKAFLDAYVANPFNPPVDDMNVIKSLRDQVAKGATYEEAMNFYNNNMKIKNYATGRRR